MEDREHFIEILKNLTSCFSPSGFEEDAKNVFIKLISPFCDEVKEDVLGNVICTKRGKIDKCIMLIAHLDEIGLMVKHIEDTRWLN